MTLPITGWWPLSPTIPIVPAAAALTITGGTPIVIYTNNYLAIPAGASLSVTGGTPIINISGGSSVVVPAAAALTITGGTPKVIANYLGKPAGAALSVTGGTPIITASGAAYDATGAGNSGSAAPGLGGISWTHVLSGSATALIVGVGNYAAATNSCKIGSTSMTLIAQQENNASGSGYVELWGLIDPPTGSQTITYTSNHTGINWVYANSVSYSGVASFGSAVTNYGSSTSLTTGNVSSASGDMVAAALSVYDQTLTLTGSGTSRYNEPTTEEYAACLIQDIAGASTRTLTATASSSAVWGTVAVNMVAT